MKKVPRAGWQTLTWCSVAWHMCKTLFINPAESAWPKPRALLPADGVPTVRWGGVKLFGAPDVSPHENRRNSETNRAIWMGPTLRVTNAPNDKIGVPPI